MPSSYQLELDVNYLMASWLILTLLAYADTAYYTSFSFSAMLQLKNKLPPVGGAAEEMENIAKLSLILV